MKNVFMKNNQMVIYQSKTGAIELRGDFRKETIWASLDQIARVFDRDKSVISRHIRHVFEEGELRRDSVVAFFATTATDGKTYRVEYYNLDVIISVGYRVNSKNATSFRQWATKTLREHITRGYTINRSRISYNYDEFMKSVADIRALLPEQMTIDPRYALDLVKEFAGTWISLDAYDKGQLPTHGTTKKSIHITAAQLIGAVNTLKIQLTKKGEATDIFAAERSVGAVEGILGNIMQTFGGVPVYLTAEEKAAHLLYFMIKNHPFVDGNKRVGAFAFVWFLQEVGLLRRSRITSPALTALTLFIAESKPKNKERMVRLILQLLKK
ncbi:virulence protein RhuM/Fic/DOC family protein [Candidatus Uhrbacteria bacterium]|nr:virulence protein RhuM/Fic/DOC family protein [Candidatus Uhrbacteria bacterium]